MTRATWNRIAKLADRAIDLQDAFQGEEADRIDERIHRMLLKAGIDQYPPNWDSIGTDYENGLIEVYNAAGNLIRTFNVLEAETPAA